MRYRRKLPLGRWGNMTDDQQVVLCPLARAESPSTGKDDYDVRLDTPEGPVVGGRQWSYNTFNHPTAEKNTDGENDEDCGTGLAQTNKQNACQCHETLQEIHGAGGPGGKRP